MRMSEKSRSTNENAAPCANEIASCAYPEISPALSDSIQSLICSRTWIRLEPVFVQPGLEAVDVDLGGGLAVRGNLDGDVVVDALGSVSRLIERQCSNSDQKRGDGRREDRVDDQHGQCAGHLEPREVAYERVQREGDHARGQEEEEHMAERSREEERHDEQNGKSDELDPARNLDRRARAGHAADRTALAGNTPELRGVRLELATVPAMATPRSRHAARLRADRRRAQARARWFAIAIAVGVLGVATLALTAFDGESRSGRRTFGASNCPSPRLRPSLRCWRR